MRKKPLEKVLCGVVGDEMLKHVPSSFDLVGNIAIIKVPPELENYKFKIGEAISRLYKSVKTVLNVSKPTEGSYRLRKYEVIWGEETTQTIHKEYGCRFKVDLQKVFFNPRLSFERKRIVDSVKPFETIINMFAGSGIVSVLIAKWKPEIDKVYSIDINPEAYLSMKENMFLNKVENKIIPILGNAEKVIKEFLLGVADRVIMLLPSFALNYLEAAIEGLKKEGGVIHFYHECRAANKDEAIKKTLNALKEKFKNDIPFKYGEKRVVRSVSPHIYHVAVDLVFR